MDADRGAELILRDFREFFSFGTPGVIMAVLVAALPLVSLALVLRGRRLPILALLVSAAAWCVWFLYYATDSIANPGLYGLGFLLMAAALGWTIMLLSVVAPWRRRPFNELLKIKTLLRPRPDLIVDLREIRRTESNR
jgi:hypothetical protein